MTGDHGIGEAPDALRRYRLVEVFYSLQGEGARAGTANVFVRFTGCNLACGLEPGPRSPGGFVCDTDFSRGEWMTADEVVGTALTLCAEAGVTLCEGGLLQRRSVGVIFTGGEPGLQLDAPLVSAFLRAGFLTAIETNGTVDLEARGVAHLLDWVCVSPKPVAGKAGAGDGLRQFAADELKVVVGLRDGEPVLPDLGLVSRFRARRGALELVVSPAYLEPGGVLSRHALRAAIAWVQQHPRFRLSVQQHKGWGVR